MISREERLQKAQENSEMWDRISQECEDELLGARVVKSPTVDTLVEKLPKYRDLAAIWAATVKELKKKGKKR